MPQDTGHDHQPHQFGYFVDDEPQTTPEHQLSSVQIMMNAGIDTSNHYLVWIHGNVQTSYQDTPCDPIQIHEQMRFISIYTGETRVS
jgi:hypothetical protein